MKITKYAHACLLIEMDGTRIITDPGSWNDTPTATEVDAVLITHEHQDHMDPVQIKDILARNPSAVVITHQAVGEKLENENIPYIAIEEGGTVVVNELPIQSFGHDHAVIHDGIVPCRNTGYLIGGRVFVPGDALHDVVEGVEVLALPTGGPWMKLSEAIDYARKVSPKAVFPIHDAMYTDTYAHGLMPRVVGEALKEAGIEFRDMGPGATEEF